MNTERDLEFLDSYLNISRRSFLKTSAAGVAALGAGGLVLAFARIDRRLWLTRTGLPRGLVNGIRCRCGRRRRGPAGTQQYRARSGRYELDEVTSLHVRVFGWDFCAPCAHAS